MNCSTPPKLSIGKLFDVLDLIKIIHDAESEVDLKKIQEAFEPRLHAAPLEEVLHICQSCHFLKIENNSLGLTPSGIRLSNFNDYDYKVRLRSVIIEFIIAFKPSWAYMMQFGKAFIKAAGALPADTKECFVEAGLFEDDLDVLKEWESIVCNLKSEDFSRNDEIGLKGEYLTMLYESKRVGSEPRWISRETDAAGFDILSKLDNLNQENLAIEVKASEQTFEDARAHITRNEWNVALNTRNYIFHFWSLSSRNPKLFITSPTIIKTHAPKDYGRGEWESFRVNFSDIFSANGQFYEID